MAKDLRTQPVRPGAKTPGKRWGEGIESIMELLGTGRRTIEDDHPAFEDTRPNRDASATAGDRKGGRSAEGPDKPVNPFIKPALLIAVLAGLSYLEADSQAPMLALNCHPVVRSAPIWGSDIQVLPSMERTATAAQAGDCERNELGLGASSSLWQALEFSWPWQRFTGARDLRF